MVNTGVFATKKERSKLFKLLKEAQNTPVIAVSSAQALAGKDFSAVAWDRVREECHRLALSHGLPEIPGYYGMIGTGEFVVAETDGNC